jgi:hypothetical protein
MTQVNGQRPRPIRDAQLPRPGGLDTSGGLRAVLAGGRDLGAVGVKFGGPKVRSQRAAQVWATLECQAAAGGRRAALTEVQGLVPVMQVALGGPYPPQPARGGPGLAARTGRTRRSGALVRRLGQNGPGVTLIRRFALGFAPFALPPAPPRSKVLSRTLRRRGTARDRPPQPARETVHCAA